MKGNILVVGACCTYRHAGDWRGTSRKGSFGRMSRIVLGSDADVEFDSDSDMGLRICLDCTPL